MVDVNILEQSRAVEALLFAQDEPVTPARLAQYVGSPALADKIIMYLCGHYNGAESAVLLLAERRMDGSWGYVLRVDPDIYAVINPDIEPEENRTLTEAQCKILLYLLYEQPISIAGLSKRVGSTVKRADLDVFVDEGWVVESGRMASRRGAKLYRTTAKLLTDLSDFGGESLFDLPDIDAVSSSTSDRHFLF